MDKKQLPKKIAFSKRFFAEVVVSLLFVSILIILNDSVSSEVINWKGIFFATFIFVILSEGIFVFDTLVAKRYPWHEAPKKRVVILFSFALMWLIIVGYFANIVRPFFIPDEGIRNKDNFALALTVLVLFLTLYVSALISTNYHKSLQFFILENEKLRREKIRMDYFALQDQLNPHFLFNNLSTLMAIIPEDPGKALRFTENFTDVYRYVLRSSKVKLITLEEELSFIKSYLNLHKERIGEGLNYKFEINDEVLTKKLPPLSLQYLIENAIKHNMATKEQPLSIFISVKEKNLSVSNNFNPKVSTYSTHTGLENLRKRYKYLGLGGDVKIVNTDDIYKVTIPLIDKKDEYEFQDIDR
ncbi:sensor histidine kinase [Thermophagus sp. OGC60D27]